MTYCVEPAYVRMAALYSLAHNEMHRSDRLSDGVNEYIEKEFLKQRAILGDQCTESALYQYSYRTPVLIQTLYGLLPDFPLVKSYLLHHLSQKC